MNLFVISCQCVILLVSFEYVRCSGDDEWTNLDETQKLWGVIINSSGDENQTLLVIKLEELEVPDYYCYTNPGTYKDAYIIYEKATNADDSSYELAVVFDGATSTSDQPKIATSIDKLYFSEMTVNGDKVAQNQVKIRKCTKDLSAPGYTVTFETKTQATDVYNKYIKRNARKP